MRSSILAGVVCASVASGSTTMQTTPSGASPRAVTRTMYTRTTELYAKWPAFIVGHPTLLTAHLTRTGDRFTPYTEGTVTLTLTVDGETTRAATDALERPGVFTLDVTPTRTGNARLVVEVESAGGLQRFVMDDVAVYADTQAAIAKEVPEEEELVSYTKEQSWKTDFATARVTVLFRGAGSVVVVPDTAIVRDGDATRVYVQRTPERFEFREVKTRRTFGGIIEIVGGLREGERIVVVGADKMPRPH